MESHKWLDKCRAFDNSKGEDFTLMLIKSTGQGNMIGEPDFIIIREKACEKCARKTLERLNIELIATLGISREEYIHYTRELKDYDSNWYPTRVKMSCRCGK